ncbi:glycerol-3-phosphate acyltransferase 1-like [Phragmites australis]|uniref:glycerol-3-phosphate acyltransferase 1-like n=1 Tax=Phragmites australis TaxID=29695 RepID=UPI002D77BF00|nr:glycerol-3-phosphate acyltransferase 1-like [Phragmites australis]
MVFPTTLPKVAAQWLFTFYRAVRKLRRQLYYRNTAAKQSSVSQSQGAAHKGTGIIPDAADRTVVCDMHGALLRSTELFPYFMLVACEGGSLLRALLLLCSFPLVWALGECGGAGVRVMAFVTFAGLRPRDVDLVARAVMPKHYMEQLNALVYDRLWLPARRKVVVTSVPRVMAEWFLKEYLATDAVIGPEMQVVRVGHGRYFTGLLCGPVLEPELKQNFVREALGADGAMANVGVVGSSNPLDHLFVPYCKEIYVVSSESAKSARLPRDKYPKPLIFHDGRLAFLPIPTAMLSFFLFLPLGVILSVIRINIGIVLPYKINFLAGALFGVRFRTSGLRVPPAGSMRRGVLYVCTHRTLVDPIMLTTALQKPVPAVTYSLSRLSEMIAPIKTVRLTRDRARDAETMSRLLQQGDLAVCPEGTTCREPYLLRFSPLFAELADDMEPVALDAQVTTLYGTTASGHKWLDPVVFFANPVPSYRVEFLGPVPREWTRAGGRSGAEVANWVQWRLGSALGFECTGLTRRDKYMMLAGNDGVVAK